MIPLSFFYWDPNPQALFLPLFNWPILWYGVLFALGFAIGFPLFAGILRRFFATGSMEPSQAKTIAHRLTDRLMVYMIVATIVGARLGHYLFYEPPSAYFGASFLQLFKIWEGGLASHGAAIAIVLALGLFARRYKQEAPGLTWLSLLDFVAAPTALAGALIRLGNFINQEILGTPTSMPWGVIFGHPADLSTPIPRHPVQLYEAVAYLALFLFLWRLTFRPSYLRRGGALIALFLIAVFGGRFIFEFWKEEQSRWLHSSLTMGQWLSLPAIVAGLVLWWRVQKNSP